MLSGCTPAEDPKAAKEMETLKKRVTKLENRMRSLEGRARAKPGPKGGKGKGGKAPAKGGKAPAKGGKAPAKGGKAGAAAPPPSAVVKVEGDAKFVGLSNGKRKFKMPGRAPFGELTVFASFNDDPPTEKGKITIPKDSKDVTIVCDAGGDACALK